jgi:hypothetical protein
MIVDLDLASNKLAGCRFDVLRSRIARVPESSPYKSRVLTQAYVADYGS